VTNSGSTTDSARPHPTWIKEFSNDEWDTASITFTLAKQPQKEKTVASCESHDRAFIGGRTLAFWLMDTLMSVHSEQRLIIDRGLALHMVIRLLIFGLVGEAHLAFMGNEFRRPEWIHFTREGHGQSFHHCQRRFDLARDHLLKYTFMLFFNNDLLQLEYRYTFMNSGNSG
jgi:1,4-alpha-glucan branching enzyme